jgi:hypothetical protein
VASNQACRGSDLLLAVEGIEQSTPDLLRCNGQVVEPIVALTWQRGWWDIQVPGEIERHGTVEKAAYGFDRLTGAGRPAADALQRLVDGVRVGEHVVGGFPGRNAPP